MQEDSKQKEVGKLEKFAQKNSTLWENIAKAKEIINQAKSSDSTDNTKTKDGDEKK
jgi:hypothetical protein